MAREILSLPIEQLEATRSAFRIQAKLQGKQLRIRFRRASRDNMHLYCSRKDAVRFSVYFE
jgi:hypothetical protein